MERHELYDELREALEEHELCTDPSYASIVVDDRVSNCDVTLHMTQREALILMRILHEASEQGFHPADELADYKCEDDGHTYAVLLRHPGPRKIECIKRIREACGIGLRQAKEAMDGYPIILANNMTRSRATWMCNTIAKSSAAVHIRRTS